MSLFISCIDVNGVVAFFNRPFFIVVSGLWTLVGVASILWIIWLTLKGVTPIWYRLGRGLSQRSVAVFSSVEGFERIRSSMVDARIFSDKNIARIPPDNIDKAKDQTLFLVDWEVFGGQIDQIFNARRNDQTAVIILAKPQAIPHEKMNEIANRSNTVVVNFRGRLLNDILNALITTSFGRS